MFLFLISNFVRNRQPIALLSYSEKLWACKQIIYQVIQFIFLVIIQQFTVKSLHDSLNHPNMLELEVVL
ncbi:hypothetical protein KPC_1821 [Acinetobacter stercoris]|uniref:Uncharacterized protein n=1 Tax=Acinetobacter stercoris TaxID=2126983 RepID=A0A2U3MZ58_9GAMM|nr:hypothetical protein KPC_1821 [Acinetobacter stercoris]